MSKTLVTVIVAPALVIFSLVYPIIFVEAQTHFEEAVIIEPAFQNIVIDDQKREVSADVTLHNTTLTPQTFEIFSQDIEQVDEHGNIALIDKPKIVNEYALAEYVRFTGPTLTLEPGEKKVIPIEISNQDSLTPGGHYAAVVVRSVSTETSGKKVILPALTSIILVHKEGGDRHDFSLQSVDSGLLRWWYHLPNQLQLKFENRGNVHMIPQGQVKITDLFGRVVKEGIVNENSLVVLPETQKIIQIELHQIRLSSPIMIYTLTVEGQTKVAQIPFSYSQSSLYVSPLFAGLVLTLIGIFLFRLGLRIFHTTNA